MDYTIKIEVDQAIKNAKLEIYRYGEMIKPKDSTLGEAIQSYTEFNELFEDYANECMANVADLIPHSRLSNDNIIYFSIKDFDENQLERIRRAILQYISLYVQYMWYTVYDTNQAAIKSSTISIIEKDILHRIEMRNTPLTRPTLPLNF